MMWLPVSSDSAQVNDEKSLQYISLLYRASKVLPYVGCILELFFYVNSLVTARNGRTLLTILAGTKQVLR